MREIRGPTFMAVSRVNYDDGAVVIITQNYDHQKLQSQTASVADEDWPRQITRGGNSFTIYQPQMEEWVGSVAAVKVVN